MVLAHADLVGLEMIVPLEHARMSAVVMEFAKISLVTVILVSLVKIAEPCSVPMSVQHKEHVTTEHVIVSAISAEQIVQ
jgi:hypothetical protein